VFPIGSQPPAILLCFLKTAGLVCVRTGWAGKHISILMRLWRIYYQITGTGAEAHAAELERYQRIVTVAQQRKLF